jgi:outer membrane protein assembly factor BamB
MKRISSLLELGLALAVTGLNPASGAAVDPAHQWPAWRGPLANGVAPHANPPSEWSEQKNVRWKVAVPGSGTSTPIVWGEQVILLTAIPASGSAAGGATAPQQWVVLSYDRATGQERWRRVVREGAPHEGHHRDHGFASASPVTDGEVLIAHFGSYGTYALDLAGQPRWEVDLGDQRTRNSFGEGSSPALHGNTVVILWDHEGDDFVVALDKRTGRELWRQRRDEPTGWSTPLIVEDGTRRVAVVNGSNRVRAYDLATGEPLWECGGQTVNVIPTPVADADTVYVTSGFRGAALLAIQRGRSGDLTDSAAVRWRLSRNTPYVPSPLLYEGLLYFFAGNNATLSIVEAAAGRVLVDGQRLEGMFGVYASPVAAAGRVYLTGRDGNCWVIKAGGGPLEVLAKNRLDDGFDASPAAAGCELFVRGRKHLYCLAQRE